MAEVLSNNASTTTVGATASTDTTITIQVNDGAEFPIVSGSDFFRVAMIKKSTGQMEIAKVVTHAAGSNTLDFYNVGNRGIEDTTALDLADGDLLELRPTAEFFNSMATTNNIQDGSPNYAADTGAADAYVVTLSPVPSGLSAGFLVRFKASADNTGASTLNVNGIGAVAIKKSVDEDITSGDIETGQIVTVVYDGTNFQINNAFGAVTATTAEINLLDGMTAGGFTPIGGIIMFAGTITALPANWHICDGNGGTPNLTAKFILGTVTQGEIGSTGGSANAINVAHTHTATTASAGGHSHTYATWAREFYQDGGVQIQAPSNTTTGTTSSVAAHTHTLTTASSGTSGTNANLPPYYKLAYIQRIS